MAVFVSANYAVKLAGVDLDMRAPLFGCPRYLSEQFLAEIQHGNHSAVPFTIKRISIALRAQHATEVAA
jgi:hypothetical protein